VTTRRRRIKEEEKHKIIFKKSHHKRNEGVVTLEATGYKPGTELSKSVKQQMS
jgi:hypothetical protein